MCGAPHEDAAVTLELMHAASFHHIDQQLVLPEVRSRVPRYTMRVKTGLPADSIPTSLRTTSYLLCPHDVQVWMHSVHISHANTLIDPGPGGIAGNVHQNVRVQQSLFTKRVMYYGSLKFPMMYGMHCCLQGTRDSRPLLL